MGLDRPADSEDGDGRDCPHELESRKATGADNPMPPQVPDLPDRAAYRAEYKKTVEAEYRAYTIDKCCDQVAAIEKDVVTPEMRRIEAEDPDRHLVGLKFRLKGRDRLTEKVTEAMEERGHTAEEAFSLVKDAIRYTFKYSDEHYTEGVLADCERLRATGFEPVDRKNSWTAEEYKGVNSRWRVPGSGQLFEVQFHTEDSFAAKQQTHSAYERLRAQPEDEDEVRRLRAYQREVTAKVPTPQGVEKIPDYDYR